MGLTRAPMPPSQKLAEPRGGFPGKGGVNRMLEEVLAHAEQEMRVRGVPRLGGGGHEARLAVWREALSLFAEQLPASQAFLSRVMSEIDAAVADLP